MRSSPALLLVTLLGCLLVPKDASGLFLEKVGQTAKDVGEKIHDGALKFEYGIKNIFERNYKSSTTTELSKTVDDSGVSTTTPAPRNIIGSVKRCLPGEVLAADECRSPE